MPLTGFLRIPDVPGESRAADHEDEIDVSDISWSVEQAAATGSGRGRRRAAATVGELVCTKWYDSSSPALALATMQGKVFDEVVVTVHRHSGDAHLDYLTITMRNVLVQAYELTGTHPEEAGDRLAEAVALGFEHVRITYVEQADDGSAGDEHEIEFDVAAGA